MKSLMVSTLLAGMLTASVAVGTRTVPSGGHTSVSAAHAVHSVAAGKGHSLSPAFKPGTKPSTGARVSPLPLGEGPGVRGFGNRYRIGSSPHPSPLPDGEGGAVAGVSILAGWRSTIEDGDGPTPSGGSSVWWSQGPEKATWGGSVGNGPGYGCVRIYEPSSPENSPERSGETFCQTGEGSNANVISGDQASLLFPNPAGDDAAHGVNYQELAGHDSEMGIHNADGSITWAPVSPDDNVVPHGDGSSDTECILDTGTGLTDPGEICTIHDHEMAIYNADGSISYDPIPANDNTVSPSGGGGQSGSGNQDDGQSSSDNNEDNSDSGQTVVASDTEDASRDDAAESPDTGGPEEGMPSPDGPDGGSAKDWQIRQQIRGPLGDPGWDSMPSPDGPEGGGPNWNWNWNGTPDPDGSGGGGPNWDDMPNPEGSEGGSPRS